MEELKEYTVTLVTRMERIYNVLAYDEDDARQTAFFSDCDDGEFIHSQILEYEITDGYSDVDAETIQTNKKPDYATQYMPIDFD